MKVIGLTGGIASGKSTASQYLKQKGCVVIDADLVARQIVEVGQPALERIKNSFGTAYIHEDQTLDRKLLGDLVFSSPEHMQKLNKIMYPALLEEITKQIKEISCHQREEWVILDAALFFEMDLQHLVDEVWYIDTDETIQITRLMQRNALSVKEAEDRINSQLRAEEKRALADVIITNNTTTEALYAQLDRCLHQ